LRSALAPNAYFALLQAMPDLMFRISDEGTYLSYKRTQST